MGVVAVDHVQLAMPVGGEDAARAFYVDLLGLLEVAKPPALAARGGCWFAIPGSPPDSVGQVHLGTEDQFVAAKKAHPGLRVDDIDTLSATLLSAGFDVAPDTSLPQLRRAHLCDPFGNRVELVQA